jgi:hypothetical protein
MIDDSSLITAAVHFRRSEAALREAVVSALVERFGALGPLKERLLPLFLELGVVYDLESLRAAVRSIPPAPLGLDHDASG